MGFIERAMAYVRKNLDYRWPNRKPINCRIGAHWVYMPDTGRPRRCERCDWREDPYFKVVKDCRRFN